MLENKQIIIDGVDVSECIRRNGFKLASYDCYLDGGCQCKANPNCNYKNYKRKEQECEELKSDLTDLSKIIDCKNGTILTFKEQLAQLKAELEAERNWHKTSDEISKVNSEYTVKLKQTLTEIKEIVKICKCHNIDGCYECKYFDDCEVEDEEIPTRDVCKLILQKISECEVDSVSSES